jgi:hypothetical protein
MSHELKVTRKNVEVPSHQPEFQFLTAVIIKSYIFWHITPGNPMKVNWYFWRSCRLHLHCQRISHARNQREAGSKLCHMSHQTSVDFQRTTQHYNPEDRNLPTFACSLLRKSVEIWERNQGPIMTKYVKVVWSFVIEFSINFPWETNAVITRPWNMIWWVLCHKPHSGQKVTPWHG